MQRELFRNDSYLKSCSAKIIEILDEGLILDNNVFYPEGGGQPGDIGVIKCGNKTYEVVNTKYVDKKIVLFIRLWYHIIFEYISFLCLYLKGAFSGKR